MHAIVALACVLACAAAMPSDLFERFMHDYKKSYASEEEKSYRQSIFAKVCRAPACPRAPLTLHADPAAHRGAQRC